MRKQTRQIESVETHNLYLSLKRLGESGFPRRWKLALYHALAMHNQLSQDDIGRIRCVLGLP